LREEGFEKGFVEKVVEQIRRNQFKRCHLAKLSNRTVGYDFLYLSWGNLTGTRRSASR
jgi:hypothetical protein